MHSSPSKADLLSELRDRYVSKYGAEPEIQGVITEQLEKIKIKPKISMKDLNDIDATVSNASISFLTKTPSNSNLLSLQSPSSKFGLNQSSIRLPMLDNQSPSYRKIIPNNLSSERSSKGPILEPLDSRAILASKNYTSSPIVLKKLRGSKSRFDLSGPTAEMFLNLSGSGVNFEKTDRYHFVKKEDIWGQIAEYQLKQDQKKEQKKLEERSRQNKNWVTDLDIQVTAHKTREKDQSQERKTTDLALVEEDQKLSQELHEKKREDQLTKQRKNKESLELALEERRKAQELKQTLRKKDAEEMGEYIQKTRRDFEEQKNKKKRQQEEIYLTNLKLQNQKAQEKFEEK